jgi:hypothetical protein
VLWYGQIQAEHVEVGKELQNGGPGGRERLEAERDFSLFQGIFKP